MTIDEDQQEIVVEYSVYDDWLDKYAGLIELGNELKPLDSKEKNDQNLIKGCQSRVWLGAERQNGLIHFRGESDAVIVKGLVALLLRVVSGRTPREIMDSELYFIDELGLKEHLSPTRANGLLAMVKQIRLYAVAFDRLEKLGG